MGTSGGSVRQNDCENQHIFKSLSLYCIFSSLGANYFLDEGNESGTKIPIICHLSKDHQ